MKPICFYHKADLDGVCSAAIVKHFVPDCELYGIDYGEEFPWDLVRPGPDGTAQEPWKSVASVDERSGGLTVVTCPKREVYMVDFSLQPCSEMSRLAKLTHLTWIDHHKTALDAAMGLEVLGYQTAYLAACELTWLWFSRVPGDRYLVRGVAPTEEQLARIPSAVHLLGAYDSWRKEDPEWDSKILPFQYGMRCEFDVYNPSAGVWFDLFNVHEGSPWQRSFLTNTKHVGRKILGYQAEVNHKACEAGAFEHNLYVIDPRLEPCDARRAEFAKRALPPLREDAADNLMAEDLNADRRWVFFQPAGWDMEDGASGFGRVWDTYEDDIGDGAVAVEISSCRTVTRYRALCCNTIVFSSQFFEGMFDPEKHDVMCAYAHMKDGRWKVGLYSTKPGIDCGAIAKSFGGGGHKGAAGFQCDKLPWEK